MPAPDHYAPFAEGRFPTPSGKCEFKSSMAEMAGIIVVPVFREGYNEFQPGGTVDPIPHYIPPAEDADGTPYPPFMLSPKPHAFLNSQYGNMAYQRRVQGEQTIVMHAETPTPGASRRANRSGSSTRTASCGASPASAPATRWPGG